MQRQQKKIKRNVKGRKPPQFARMIMTILKDATVTTEELMESSPTKTLDEDSGRIKATYETMPENSTVIASLNGSWLFKDERLFRHLDLIARAQAEFSPLFYEDEGLSLLDLRYDKKNRVWGDEIAVCGFAYLLIASGLAEWTQPRECWKNNPDKMPKLRFIKKYGERDENATNEKQVNGENITEARQ